MKPAAGAGLWTERYLKLRELVARAWRRRIDAALEAEGGIPALYAARAAVLAESEKFAASADTAAATDGASAPAAAQLRAFVADLRGALDDGVGGDPLPGDHAAGGGTAAEAGEVDRPAARVAEGRVPKAVVADR